MRVRGARYIRGCRPIKGTRHHLGPPRNAPDLQVDRRTTASRQPHQMQGNSKASGSSIVSQDASDWRIQGRRRRLLEAEHTPFIGRRCPLPSFMGFLMPFLWFLYDWL